MEGNTTIKSLKARYEEAVRKGDRIDKKSKSVTLPALPIHGDKSNQPPGPPDGIFLTQKASVRNQTKREVEDLEHLLNAATQTTQTTLLLKKRKEMKEVDDALELMKKDHKRRMDECEERRVQFEINQSKLREQVQKFEKFIQENDSKRQRAEAKVKYERKQYEERCREYLILIATIQELEGNSQKLQKELSKQKKYGEYLESIIEHGDYGYEEVSDILNRHKTLVAANEDLVITSGEREKDLDELRMRLNALKIEKQNQLLVGNSSIQSLQNQLEAMRSAVKVEEEGKHHLEDKQKDISKELSQVVLAVKNIYSRCISSMTAAKSSTLMNCSNNLFTSIGSSSSASLSASVSNKNLLLTSEKLDQNLAVIHARMGDLISMIDEFPESGFSMPSVASAMTPNSSNGAGNMTPTPSLFRQYSTNNIALSQPSLSSNGAQVSYQPSKSYAGG